jgi:hypothetical protein
LGAEQMRIIIGRRDAHRQELIRRARSIELVRSPSVPHSLDPQKPSR